MDFGWLGDDSAIRAVEERRARVGTKLGPRRSNCAECRRRRSDDSVALLALATSPSGRVRA